MSRARTAKQWERFKEDKALYPNIEWELADRANMRELLIYANGQRYRFTRP
ncbi:MAG: hypothetical protein LBK47_09915 [Prevotellaceae bacterium]|nr:hypothetical protein [Prevotellaceae bacterium]